MLSLQSEGVTESHLAAGSVTGSETLDGAIQDSDVSATAAIAPSKVAGTAATLSFDSQSFDNGLVHLDAINNRVGINNSQPAAPLDVAGTSRATTFEYRSSRSFYHYVRASEFHPSSTVMSWVTVASAAPYGYTNDGIGDSIYAPLRLPQGADIANLRCYYRDWSSNLELEDLEIQLYAASITSATSYTLAETISDPPDRNSSTIYYTSDTSVSGIGDPVNNAGYHYSIRVYWDLATPTTSGGHSGVRFYGCRVRYNMTQIAH